MRLTILFLLIVSISGLTIKVLYLNASQFGNPLNRDVKSKFKQIKEIRQTSDIAALRETAVDLVVGRDDAPSITVNNLLFLMILLCFTSVILAFLEIAARGRSYMINGGKRATKEG